MSPLGPVFKSAPASLGPVQAASPGGRDPGVAHVLAAKREPDFGHRRLEDLVLKASKTLFERSGAAR
jgi:hypothetical protein